jgi:hypothetical protein
VAEAAPFPIFRALAQPTPDGIAVDITQLFNMLLIVANVEVIISRLPEMQRVADQSTLYSLLQRFDCVGQCVSLRFAEKEMNVLGHDDIAINAQLVALSNAFERDFEYLL